MDTHNHPSNITGVSIIGINEGYAISNASALGSFHQDSFTFIDLEIL